MAVQIVKSLKLVSLVICIVLFCLLMTDIFDKYSKKLTSVGVIIEEYEQNEKELPCFTLCPWKGFKNPGFHYIKDDFQRNVFNQAEIFRDEPGKNYVNTSHYTVTEIDNIFIGRCFMVCYLTPAKKLIQSYVLLRREVDMKVFVHRHEDRVMIAMGTPPIGLTTFMIEPQSKNDTVEYEFKVTERRITNINKKTSPCHSYDGKGQSFSQCVKDFIGAYIQAIMTCFLPGFEEFTNNTTRLKPCLNYLDANNTLYQLLPLVFQEEKMKILDHCPIPCEQTIYVSKLNKYHKNNYLVSTEEATAGERDSIVFMSIGYETLNTELHFETLIYDTGNLLTQIGGNLGLFLGISCFSILVGVIEFLQKGYVCNLFKFRR